LASRNEQLLVNLINVLRQVTFYLAEYHNHTNTTTIASNRNVATEEMYTCISLMYLQNDPKRVIKRPLSNCHA